MKNKFTREEVLAMLFGRQDFGVTTSENLFKPTLDRIEKFKKTLAKEIPSLENVHEFRAMQMDYNYLINLISERKEWTRKDLKSLLKHIEDVTKIQIVKEISRML